MNDFARKTRSEILFDIHFNEFLERESIKNARCSIITKLNLYHRDCAKGAIFNNFILISSNKIGGKSATSWGRPSY